jgi:hypothetical protein
MVTQWALSRKLGKYSVGLTLEAFGYGFELMDGDSGMSGKHWERRLETKKMTEREAKAYKQLTKAGVL